MNAPQRVAIMTTAGPRCAWLTRATTSKARWVPAFAGMTRGVWRR